MINISRIIILFLLAVSVTAYSQRGNVMETLDPQYQNSALLYNKASLDDTPYLVNQFLIGTVNMKDGKQVKDIELKYDIQQQLLLMRTGDEMGVINNKLIDSFEITLPDETSKSIFVTRPDGFFYQMLYSGEIKFLKKCEKTKRNREQYQSTGYNTDGPKPSVFVKKETYFLLISDNLTSIKLSKKSVLSVLHDPKFEACAKASGLRLNSVDDVVSLLKDCK